MRYVTSKKVDFCLHPGGLPIVTIGGLCLCKYVCVTPMGSVAQQCRFIPNYQDIYWVHVYD